MRGASACECVCVREHMHAQTYTHKSRHEGHAYENCGEYITVRTLKNTRPFIFASGTGPYCLESVELDLLSPSSHTCPVGTVTCVHWLRSLLRTTTVSPGCRVAMCTYVDDRVRRRATCRGYTSRTMPTIRLHTVLPFEFGESATITWPLWYPKNLGESLSTKTTSPSVRKVGIIEGPKHCTHAQSPRRSHVCT
jgi:hypothetical protein